VNLNHVIKCLNNIWNFQTINIYELSVVLITTLYDFKVLKCLLSLIFVCLCNATSAALHHGDGDSDAFAHIKDTISGNLKLLGTDLSSFALYECLCLSLCLCIITYTLHREH